jgi:neutral amino acid transport system permease protein
VEDVLQSLVFGLTTGSIIAIAAIGLTLVYGILRLTNFAHGDMMTLGAFIAWWVTVSLGLPFVFGVIAAMLAVSAFGVASEFVIWRPLRKREAGLLQMLLMAIGLALALRYAIQLVAGARLRRLDVDVYSSNDFGPIRVSDLQIMVIGLAAVMLTIVGLLLAKTLLGKSMRAVSDNFGLAEASGIDTNRVVVVTWMLSGALAGFAGVLAAIFVDVNPNLGWNLLLTIFAATILGGIGNAYGALIGGYVIGLAQEMSVLVIPSEFKTMVGFVVLILVLLVRPQGILGRRQAVG